ncbi:hypothetical protein [Streptomyces sp. 6N223]|uniref:hypothetical protein n=1 Tax=Streptomyces sp. 6N223 TaxID=3457412 RepID=UPI003FD40670
MATRDRRRQRHEHTQPGGTRRPRGVRTTLLAAIAACALALIATGAGATPAAADHPEIQQPFFADHTRTCQYSYAEGELNWAATHDPEPHHVDVTGVVAEKHPDDCDTHWVTYAEFTAYIKGGTEPVDFASVPLGELDLTLSGDPALSEARIDLVTVRVCQNAGPSLPAFTCGEPVSVTPAGSAALTP